MPEAAATPTDQRGPNRPATQPTNGAPNGVQPNATASRIAMTRPRIAGSVEICIKLLDVLAKVRAETPITASAAAKNQTLGIRAATPQASPNTAAPEKRCRKCGRSRPATKSEPATVP